MKDSNGSVNAALVRQDFSGSQMQAAHETASTAVAAQSRAATESRYLMAISRPRDWDHVRAVLLRECKRSGFAEVAEYKKPAGDDLVRGPSIRFVEAALRCLGNVYPETTVTYDDNDRRIVRVTVTDLEANITYAHDVVVTKTVERKKLHKGQRPLRSRTNSYGQTVHLVEATEDALATKQAALVSKALRTCGLRCIPGDLVDEAMAVCRKTREDGAARDPDAERKRVADSFAGLNVTPRDLSEYLGHDLGKVSPSELAELREIYAAIRDGETSWHAVIEKRREQREQAAQESTATAPARGTEAVKRAVSKNAAASSDKKPAVEPRLGGPEGGIRFSEWALRGDAWVGLWQDTEADTSGEVRTDLAGKPAEPVEQVLAEAIAWAFKESK